MVSEHGVPVAPSFDGFVQPCHKCRGTGVIPRSWTLQSLWFRIRGVMECPTCHGLGFTKSSLETRHGETPTREFDVVR
jgi:DnaJ-class molecular chaperone